MPQTHKYVRTQVRLAVPYNIISPLRKIYRVLRARGKGAREENRTFVHRHVRDVRCCFMRAAGRQKPMSSPNRRDSETTARRVLLCFRSQRMRAHAHTTHRYVPTPLSGTHAGTCTHIRVRTTTNVQQCTCRLHYRRASNTLALRTRDVGVSAAVVKTVTNQRVSLSLSLRLSSTSVSVSFLPPPGVLFTWYRAVSRIAVEGPRVVNSANATGCP